MTMRLALTALRLGFGLLALSAIVRQLAIQAGMGFSLVNFFSYFTNLSNLSAALVLVFSACRGLAGREPSAAEDAARTVSAVNMAVVGIVYAALLRDVDLGSLLPWVNVVLHIVMPCTVVLDWLAQPSSVRLGLRHILRCLVFPAVYLAYVLIRGSGTGWYPYPFLNPANVGGYGGVAVYALGIAITFAGVACALLAWSRFGVRPRPGAAPARR